MTDPWKIKWKLPKPLLKPWQSYNCLNYKMKQIWYSFLYNKSWEIGRKITLPSVCELCVSTVIHHNVLHPTINIGILITSYLINMRIHLSTYQYESGLGFCIIRSHNLVHHVSIFFSIIEKMIWKLGNYRKIVHW